MTTPSELFYEWLEKRPGDARVAVAIDSDRFLADARVLDKPAVVDPAGREWALVVFRGDDLSFRLRFREASTSAFSPQPSAFPRVVIVLTRGPGVDTPIDVSYVADVLARNEAGEPLDLSVPAFFRRITPKINCPVAELRRFKTDLLARLDYAQDAADKLIQRWGKPDSWGRGQVAAMVVLAHHPELGLDDIWTDEIEPAEFLAHAIRLLVGRPDLSARREVVQQIVHEAAREQVEALLFWTEIAPEELAGYLVLRDLAGQVNLQNPSTQLAGLQLFPPDLRLADMEKLAPKVIAALKKGGVWSAIEQRAEVFLTPARAAKVLTLLPPITGTDADASFLLAQTTPAILRQHLRSALDGFFAKPSAQALAWVPDLEKHPLLTDADASTERARQCRAGLWLLLALRRAEAGVAVPLPNFPHADALLDWYVQNGQHLLELEISQAAHCLAEFDDDDLIQRGQQYLFGMDELRPTPESLKGRVVERLEQLDQALAGFVRPDPEKFCRGARNVRGLLRAKIDVKQIAADTLPGRVWVLVFDGMRLDTWERIVRPLLAVDFKVDDQPYYCVLPSYTEIARTGLLAGGVPSEWKGFKGTFSQDESQLFAVNMGLTAQEAKTKLRYVTGADTTKARKKLGFADKDAPLLNVLIYPVSDEEAHDFEGDLASLNNVIRTKMLGDKSAGIRGILDDLLKRIGPDDLVVLTSDHGFKELLQGDAVPVAEAEAKKAGLTMEESIRWRYVEGFAPAAMPDAVKIAAGTQDVWMALGRRWFMREGTKIMPRYSHGGLSLAEVVVPGVVLRRVTEKTARAELLNLPTVLQAEEDAVVELPFTVRNTGNCEIEFEVRVANNLGQEVFQHQAQLAPATSAKLTASVLARYRETPAREPDPTGTVSAVTLRLRHTDLSGTWREALDGRASIPVRIKPKAVKFDTDALKGFDDV
jgi:hypothetical protein